MATREDREFYTRMWEQNQMLNNGCGTPFYIALIIGVVLLFSSCATKKHIVENDHQKTEVKVDSTDVQSVKVDSTDTEHKTEIKETEKVETETKVEKSDSTVMTVDAETPLPIGNRGYAISLVLDGGVGYGVAIGGIDHPTADLCLYQQGDRQQD